MADNDRAHFESYREQTEVKHAILEKYLFAYFNILKGTHQNLVYIDGFAGQGHYSNTDTGETFDGSPLRALKKVASLDNLKKKVCCLFIEKDPVLAVPLKNAVYAFYAANPDLREPNVAVGEFAEQLSALLQGLEERNARLAPTFLFVDPCGVAGASFDAIKQFMANDSCEALIFFNIDGVRRILGLNDGIGPTLPQLLGSESRARTLLERVGACATPSEKEEVIVAYYDELIRQETGAKYVTMFRVENEHRKVTSHYLVHVAKHPKGLRIMKDVMWSVGRTSEGQGGLALEQASVRGGHTLFRPGWDKVKSSILDELAHGPQRVGHFYETLPEHPENKLCESAYRQALLELEDDGRLIVTAKDGSGTPTPTRRLRKGMKTLAKDYYVQRNGT